jgi:hypothetical protein
MVCVCVCVSRMLQYPLGHAEMTFASQFDKTAAEDGTCPVVPCVSALLLFSREFLHSFVQPPFFFGFSRMVRCQFTHPK